MLFYKHYVSSIDKYSFEVVSSSSLSNCSSKSAASAMLLRDESKKGLGGISPVKEDELEEDEDEALDLDIDIAEKRREGSEFNSEKRR